MPPGLVGVGWLDGASSRRGSGDVPAPPDAARGDRHFRVRNDQTEAAARSGVVLTRKVGTERSFPVVALLFVLTFGLYGIYWHYKVQNELYKQFELYQEPRDEGVVWLLYGYVVFRPLLWVFVYILVDNVQHVRARFGMPGTPTPARVVTLAVLGAIVGYAGLGFLYAGAVLGLDPVPPDDMSREEAASLATLLTGLAVLFLLTGALLLVLAYAPLQHAVNQVWRAFDDRMAQLRPQVPEGLVPWPAVGPGTVAGPPTRAVAGGPYAPAGGSGPAGRAPPGWTPER